MGREGGRMLRVAFGEERVVKFPREVDRTLLFYECVHMYAATT